MRAERCSLMIMPTSIAGRSVLGSQGSCRLSCPSVIFARGDSCPGGGETEESKALEHCSCMAQELHPKRGGDDTCLAWVQRWDGKLWEQDLQEESELWGWEMLHPEIPPCLCPRFAQGGSDNSGGGWQLPAHPCSCERLFVSLPAWAVKQSLHRVAVMFAGLRMATALRVVPLSWCWGLSGSKRWLSTLGVLVHGELKL